MPRTYLLLSLLILSTSRTSGQTAPPAVAGVGIGSAPSAVRKALGAPDREQASLGMRFWDYTRRALTVIWRDDAAGVQGLIVRGRPAGPLNGIRVGDDTAAVRRAWGPPARVRQGGRYADFVGAHWVISAELVDGHVVQLTLMNASGASTR